MSSPTIAVIDYGMGNLRSVCKALEFVGARPILIEDPAGLEDASAIVFPGQGALEGCVKALKKTGLDTAIRDWIAADKPYLGICLGLQALFEYSEEANVPALGVFPGRVVRFHLPPEFKIPHMGWNQIRFLQEDSPLRKGLGEEDQFYFVHIMWCRRTRRSRSARRITASNLSAECKEAIVSPRSFIRRKVRLMG